MSEDDGASKGWLELTFDLQIRTVAFKIINSSTRLLPEWKRLCEEEGLPIRLLSRDVRTRWNSTFDMLDFAVWYCAVVDEMTAKAGNGLRAYELDETVWAMLWQVQEILKVRVPHEP